MLAKLGAMKLWKIVGVFGFLAIIATSFAPQPAEAVDLGGSIRIGPVGVRIGNGGVRWNVGGGGGGAGGGAGYWDEAAATLACTVLMIPEGAFGALIMIISGIVAVVGAALGMYRMALSTLVVGIGSFLIMPLVTLFWGDYLACY